MRQRIARCDRGAHRAGPRGLLAPREQPFHFGAQRGISSACVIEKRAATVRRQRESAREYLFDLRPTFRRHPRAPSANCVFIQPLAIAQSSLTVRWETPNASAVSSTESPAK